MTDKHFKELSASVLRYWKEQEDTNRAAWKERHMLRAWYWRELKEKDENMP